MLHIGCHLPSSGGYYEMGKIALSIGADTFQFFTRNPRGGSVAKAVDCEDMARLRELMSKHSFAPIVAHAPYTLNCASAKDTVREFARMIFADDLRILENLPGNYYNFHPGSHIGAGLETGVRYICDTLDEVMFEGMRTKVLLETMAGKGSEIGSRFEELRAIIDGVKLSQHIGVCLDTCHVSDSGNYDIISNLYGVLEEFDRVIGIDRLKAVHLNDSMNAPGSKKDRHSKIGDGEIGLDALARVVNHPALRQLPFILETPNELDGYEREIRLMRSKAD